MDFSHAVIGAGAVGLAIGARLARMGHRVVLLDRHALVGQETSSRNSEVVHAGIYYPVHALRTALCIRGKHAIYNVSKKFGVEVNNCGKWIVAQNAQQQDHLNTLYNRAKETGVPLEWISLHKAKELEPAVKVGAAVLNSPTTGIVSAHSLMSYLESEIQASDPPGEIALRTDVKGIEKLASGYKLSCICDGEAMDFTADSVINSAGLHAPNVSNMLLPKSRHVTAYYAKGTYFSYLASKPKPKRLIYPCPSHSGSLGTHLTIDMQGAVRFGPDLEFVDSPEDLRPSVGNLEAARKAIAEYIEIDNAELVPDYSGIRPKIIGTTGFQDFVIREEEGFPGFVNLLNIESPGLTSCMAIAEEVGELVGR